MHLWSKRSWKITICILNIISLTTLKTVNADCTYYNISGATIADSSSITCSADEKGAVGTTLCVFGVSGTANVTLSNSNDESQPSITQYVSFNQTDEDGNTIVTVTLTASIDDLADEDSYLQGTVNCQEDMIYTILFIVRVNTFNDHTPEFTGGPYSVPDVSETFPSGIDILAFNNIVITATDGDTPGDPTSLFTFHLEDDFDGSFSVENNNPDDASQLQLFINKALDYNKYNDYILNVFATDQGTPPLNSTATVQITLQITDVDNLDPAFDYNFYTAEVSSLDGTKQDLTTSPAPINAYDQDTGINAPLSYGLVFSNTDSCNDDACKAISAAFTINPTTAVISIDTSVDLSAVTTGVASFSVQATQVDDSRHFAYAFVSVTLPSATTTTGTTSNPCTTLSTEASSPSTTTITTEGSTDTPTTSTQPTTVTTADTATDTESTSTFCTCPTSDTTNSGSSNTAGTDSTTVSSNTLETDSTTGSITSLGSDSTTGSTTSPDCPTITPIPCTTIIFSTNTGTGGTEPTLPGSTGTPASTMPPEPANDFFITVKSVSVYTYVGTAIAQLQDVHDDYYYSLTDNTGHESYYFEIGKTNGIISVKNSLHPGTYVVMVNTINSVDNSVGDNASVSIEVNDEPGPTSDTPTTATPDCDDTVYIAVISVLSVLLGICLIAFGVYLCKSCRKKDNSAIYRNSPLAMSNDSLKASSLRNDVKLPMNNVESEPHHIEVQSVSSINKPDEILLQSNGRPNEALSTELCKPVEYADEPILDRDSVELVINESFSDLEGESFQGDPDSLSVQRVNEDILNERMEDKNTLYPDLEAAKTPDPDPDYVQETKSILIDHNVVKIDEEDGEQKTKPSGVKFNDTPEVIDVNDVDDTLL